MAYTATNFKTKKALKEAIADGRKITVFQPGGLFPDPPFPGTCCIEGPHFPKPHKWYAQVTLNDQGFITEVK
jgi:hypothetical protein